MINHVCYELMYLLDYNVKNILDCIFLETKYRVIK